jgi:hypothetical protein
MEVLHESSVKRNLPRVCYEDQEVRKFRPFGAKQRSRIAGVFRKLFVTLRYTPSASIVFSMHRLFLRGVYGTDDVKGFGVTRNRAARNVVPFMWFATSCLCWFPMSETTYCDDAKEFG